MIEIIQGKKAQLTVRLRNATNGVEGDPIDLTTITEISACFVNTDGTELTLRKTTGGVVVVGSPLIGKIQLVLTAAQTALMAITDHETLEIDLTFGVGVDPIGMQIRDAYSVIASRC